MSARLRDRLADPDRRVRSAAVAELSQRRDDEAAELLDLALDDPSRLVRFRAVEALGRVGTPRALALLLTRMDNETQPTTLRRFALDAVVAIGTPEAAAALEARMDTYSSARGRRVVAKKIAGMSRAREADPAPEVTPLENYATPDNLLARMSIHSYAVNPHWTEWLFEHELPEGSAALRILDVGCGTAALWTSNREQIDLGWEITLADSSPDMLETARRELGERMSYVLADIQDLPWEEGSFDIVLANHMLYHVPDRPRAFAEIGRVLSPGGSLHASTNGRGHLAELAALVPDATNIAAYTEEFGLETGPPQLEPFFADVTVQRFDNSLRVPSPEPVLAYLDSSDRYRAGIDMAAARATVVAEIERTGVFAIQTRPGLISCRKPSPP